MRELEQGSYRFDEIEVGDFFYSASRQVSAAEIAEFARLSGDHFEIHISREAAQRHGFRDIVAHGLFVLAMTDGLKNNCGVWIETQASLGWDQSFTAPVLAGDRISVRVEVAAKRPISDPSRGIVTIAVETTNQDGVTVMRGENRLMVYR